MANPNLPKRQQLINNGTGAITYAVVDPGTTYETRYIPGSAAILAAKTALDPGYTWAIVGPASSGSATLDQAVGIKPSYSGQIDTANTYQSDTQYLQLAVVEVNSNGYVRYDNVASGRNPTDGRQIRYAIENGYTDTLSGKFFSPDYPLLVFMFWVNPGVEDWRWQSNDPSNAQYASYFKAWSLINIS